MATKKQIQHEAPKGGALTLDDVAAFVEDARQSGASGAEVVAVTATWGAKIRSLTVDVTTPAPDPFSKA